MNHKAVILHNAKVITHQYLNGRLGNSGNGRLGLYESITTKPGSSAEAKTLWLKN